MFKNGAKIIQDGTASVGETQTLNNLMYLKVKVYFMHLIVQCKYLAIIRMNKQIPHRE